MFPIFYILSRVFIYISKDIDFDVENEKKITGYLRNCAEITCAFILV